MDERGRARAFALLPRLGRLTRAQLLAYRDAQLRRLLAHAAARVPFHRGRLAAQGLGPRDVLAADALDRWPESSRQGVQQVPLAELLEAGADPARLLALKTAGSSARPLTLYRSRGEERLRSALRQRALHDLGVRPWDRTLGLRVGVRPRDPRRPDTPQRLLRGLGVFRRHQVPVDAGLAAALAELRRLRPDVLMAYPSVLARLAHAAEQDGGPAPRVRLAVCGSEVLTPLLRAQIRDAFGAAVRDWYGCHETGLIALECPDTGLLHVAEHTVVLEVLRDGRPAAEGESGEAVVTSLHAFTMPFIRYRLGDAVTRGPAVCPCGAPFATLAGVDGRTWETATLANGRVIHPVQLNRLVQAHAQASVRQFQLVQERPDAVALLVVPRAAPADVPAADLGGALAQLVGPGIAHAVRLVPDIAGEAGGKFRQVRALPAAAPPGVPRA